MKLLSEYICLRINDMNISIKEVDSQDSTSYERIQAYRNSLEYKIRFIKQNIISNINKLYNKQKIHRAIFGIILRIYCHLISLQKLDKSIDFQCYAFITRSIYELYIDILLLSKNVINNSEEKFYKFHEIQRFNVSTKISNTREKIDIKENFITTPINSNQYNKEDIDKIITQLWGLDKNKKPKKIDHWSGLDLFSRVKKLKEFPELYNGMLHFHSEIIYYSCMYIHSDPTGIINQKEEFFDILCQKFLIEIHEMVVSFLKYAGNYYHLDKVISDYHKIVEDIESSPILYLYDIKIEKIKNNC